MARFTVEYYPGEDDRQSSWDVVEWYQENNGVRMGRVAGRFEYDEEAAHQLCGVLQEAYNLEFYSEFG